MLPVRTPAWAAAMVLAATPVVADSAPAPRNVLVATTVADSTNQALGVMMSEQTCWQAALMLAKVSPAQVFYCVENPVRVTAPPLVPKGKTVRS